MPTAISATILPSTPPGRVRLTRQMCAALQEGGLIEERYELIDGVLLSKMGQKPPHAYTLRRVLSLVIRLFGDRFVQAQLPIRVCIEEEIYNEPEPDIVVLSLPYESYLRRHPNSEEIRLLVEISHSTLDFDLSVKSSLYARAGVSEYWVVDIDGRRLVAHREPSANGYASVLSYDESEAICPLCRPEISLGVGELLPPADTE